MKLLYISLAAIAIILSIFLMKNRGRLRDPKGQLALHSHQLLGIAEAWKRIPKSDQTNMIQFVSAWTNFGVDIFTNKVIADGVSYDCVFTDHSETFAQEGFLAVTGQRELLWIGQQGEIKLLRKGQDPYP